MLLVDSEEPVAGGHGQDDNPLNWLPWAHLQERSGDGWERPIGSKDADCHLMVQVMESWFLADRATLKSFFGQGFNENRLPAPGRDIHSLSKADVYRALQNATSDCKTKAPYGKGAHSFKILARINPAAVTAKSAWAERFVMALQVKMSIK